jgi:hypothetical protein
VRAVEHLRLVMAEVLVATVRNQVALSRMLSLSLLVETGESTLLHHEGIESRNT